MFDCKGFGRGGEISSFLEKIGTSFYVAFGGKASVAGHLEVGDHAKLAAKSGVTKSLSGGETYAGMPAREISEKNRQDAHISRMPMMAKKLKELEKRLAELEKNG